MFSINCYQAIFTMSSVLWFLLLTVTVACVTGEPKDDKENYRLPEDVILPQYYSLRLIVPVDKLNDGDPQYEGMVSIVLSATRTNVSSVILNAEDMEITSSLLEDEYGIVKLSVNSTTPNQFGKVEFPLRSGFLQPNVFYVLTLKFIGHHRDNLFGFYKSYYFNEQGEVRWMLATQFQSVYARRAFPCFDEPRYKARFTVSISIPKSMPGYSVLSNTPLSGQPVTDPENADYIQYSFETTPVPLSTYLLAFIVSEFKSTEPAIFYSDYQTQVDEKEYRTWARPQLIDANQGHTSQLVGPKILEYFTLRFDIGYPLQKADLGAIPDFALGGMENLGLVMFKERVVLLDEETASLSTKQGVVEIITHELTHQWFGDLVTTHSWDDIWLNEGFADYFGYFASGKIENDGLVTTGWEMDVQFVTEEMHLDAFEVDALPSSRPTTQVVYSPADIQANFDSIAYSKSACIIRMLSHILGEANFYAGLRVYLQERQGNITTPEILTATFQKTIGQLAQAPGLQDETVDDVFYNWHTRPGYPVVKCSSSGTNVTCTQQRFLLKNDTTKAVDTTRWYVPLTYTTDQLTDFDKTATQAWLTEQNDISFNVGQNAWYLINIQQTGYYRVLYEDSNWISITNYLKDEEQMRKIHKINRAQLLDDSLSLAQSTYDYYLSYDIALNLTLYLYKEFDYIPWSAALNKFSFLKSKIISDEQLYGKFRLYLIGLIDNQYKKLTFEEQPGESHTDKLNRALLIDWACTLEYSDCTDKSNALFDAFLTDDTPVHPDIRKTVYCSSIRNGTKEDWDWLWYLYQTSNTSAEQQLLLAALGCSKDEQILQEYLMKTINPAGGIRSQDRGAAYSAVYNGNQGNVKLAFQFMKDHITDMANNYGGFNPLRSPITGIAEKLTTQQDLNDMINLALELTNSQNPLLNQGAPAAEQGVNIIEGNILWLALKQPELRQWFDRV